MPDFPMTIVVSSDGAGQRLDQYLATQLSEVSRARVQQLIAKGDVLVNGAAAKASQRLKGNGEEQITVRRCAPWRRK
jgi:23S rRNA pseudouridine1911/1915/1917 synthase